MAEPDVTADDVQRFLKEVAKRQVCPSCGSEEEPTFLIESHFIVAQHNDVMQDTSINEFRTENYIVHNKQVPGIRLLYLAQRIFSSFPSRKARHYARPFVVLCPNCGKMDTYAFDRVRDWLRGQQNG